MSRNIILVYTYYSDPWRKTSGDTIRIQMIIDALSNWRRVAVVVLTHKVNTPKIYKAKQNLIYIMLPRRFYRLLTKILRWNIKYDLDPLQKLSHYIDEFFVSFYLWKMKPDLLILFGSMSLSSFILRKIFGLSKDVQIIYDALGNYTQTLYLRSRTNLFELIRYGLYLALHSFQLVESDKVVYPSRFDEENAKRQFRTIKETIVIPNPFPVCYKNIDEYESLNASRKDFSKPYFVLIAGGKGKGNEEAVKQTIKIFNELPPERFRLFITGPWYEMNRYIRNPSIELLGVISQNKLKQLLAISDYGLSPVFKHAAGTFLKVLGYAAAGLDVIVSPFSLMGIDLYLFKSLSSKVLLVNDINAYELILKKLVQKQQRNHSIRKILICDKSYSQCVKTLMENI